MLCCDIIIWNCQVKFLFKLWFFQSTFSSFRGRQTEMWFFKWRTLSFSGEIFIKCDSFWHETWRRWNVGKLNGKYDEVGTWNFSFDNILALYFTNPSNWPLALAEIPYGELLKIFLIWETLKNKIFDFWNPPWRILYSFLDTKAENFF